MINNFQKFKMFLQKKLKVINKQKIKAKKSFKSLKVLIYCK